MNSLSSAKPARSAAAMQRSFRRDVWEIHARMSPGRQRHLRYLLILMLFSTFAEIGTIGAVVPLLSLIGRPETLRHYPLALAVLGGLGATTQSERLVIAAGTFSAFAIAGGALRFQLSRATFSFGYELAHELTLEIQRRLLLQPYGFHVERNTSTLISALEKENVLIFDLVLPLMQAAIAAFISVFIVAILMVVDPLISIVATLVFSSIYVLASALTKSRLASNSEVVSRGFDDRMKIVQESLGGIRDVIIDGAQTAYLAQFERANSTLARARANTAAISLGPRYLIETAGIIAIALIALAVSVRKGDLAGALPTLGAMAIGAQRLLPLLQQVYRGWSTASGHLSIIRDTVDLLSLPIAHDGVRLTGGEPIELREKMVIQDLHFTYPNCLSPAVAAISFEVPAGSSMALIGETGSGKSTLADLMMGLLDADAGSIVVDGIPLTRENSDLWQRNIAHVSQSVFLVDASIASNIALSKPDSPLDEERIIEAAKKAQLHDFVASLPSGYETRVGERGIRLSGGQRQCLGIARAIYKGVPIFVLDEATSALDEATERAVMSAFEGLQRTESTIIIIAHRPSTIRHCDLVVRLNQGRLTEIDRPKAVISSSRILF